MQTDEYGQLFEHEDRYWWFVARRKLALTLLQDALGSQNIAGNLVDLGCGTGAALADLSAMGTATGVDFSSLALEFSQKRGLKRLVLGDGQNIPLQSESVKGMISLDIFEHIPDDIAAFRESFRILEPGGVLVLSVPAFQWLWGPHDVALMHFRRYTKGQVLSRLAEAGFIVEKASYSVFWLFPVVVLLRLRDRISRREAKVSLPQVSDSMNNRLIRLQDWEMERIRKGSLPWGSSVVAIARKPKTKT